MDSDNPVGFVRRRLFRWMFNDGEIDVIATYREALKEAVQQRYAATDYVFVPFAGIAADYRQHLNLYREDHIHLNERGCEQLAVAIADAVEMYLAPVSPSQ